jgi:hypothetical protein
MLEGSRVTLPWKFELTMGGAFVCYIETIWKDEATTYAQRFFPVKAPVFAFTHPQASIPYLAPHDPGHDDSASGVRKVSSVS